MTSLEEFMVVNLYKIIAIINAQFIPSVVFTIHYYKIYLPCISFLRLIKNLNATTDQRFQMDKKHSSLQGKNNKSNANGGLLSVCCCRHFMQNIYYIYFISLKLSTQLYVRRWTFYSCGKHLHDLVISLRREIRHHILFTPPRKRAVTYLCQWYRLCLCFYHFRPHRWCNG